MIHESKKIGINDINDVEILCGDLVSVIDGNDEKHNGVIVYNAAFSAYGVMYNSEYHEITPTLKIEVKHRDISKLFEIVEDCIGESYGLGYAHSKGKRSDDGWGQYLEKVKDAIRDYYGNNC